MTKIADFQQMMIEAHKKFGTAVHTSPDLGSLEERERRFGFVIQEVDELRKANLDGDLVGIADALGDLLYIVVGTAVTHGLDIDGIFQVIHQSNMTKEASQPHPDGKWIKGKDYKPPNLKMFVMERIVQAAIRRDGVVYTGRRHGDIIRNNVGVFKRPESTQGFITETGRFVDRAEAAKIAYACGQIKKPQSVLMSEDLY